VACNQNFEDHPVPFEVSLNLHSRVYNSKIGNIILVKVKLLPSSFNDKGHATLEQRLTCYVINDRVAIDAGSLALAGNEAQRRNIRDVIITHPHMDHIASLPIFIDDLFNSLTAPIRIYATEETIKLLERDIFNWTIYPRFSELTNKNGPVMEYIPLCTGREITIADLSVTPVAVDHTVSTIGLVISNKNVNVAFGSDTAETEELWQAVNNLSHLEALFIEASFPNALSQLAFDSGHLTPHTLKKELGKLNHSNVNILAVHLKPAYRETLIQELNNLNIPALKIMEPGREYRW
jgi:cAMP phosphodiesterase